jgi:ribonuclease R
MLEQLLELASQLRSWRLANGSIDLDLPLPALDCLGDLATPEPDESRRGWLVQLPLHNPVGLLRELVLPAGRAFGEHVAALQLPGLFSVNPAADPAEVNEVAKAALALEIPLELADDGNAPAAAELAVAFAATDRSRVLQRQLSDVLPPIQLSDQPEANNLAAAEVAFASWCFPALHYADLWNQHLLVVLLTEGKDRPSVRHKVRVDLASDLCHGSIDWPLLPPSQLSELEASRSSALIQRLNNASRFVLELQADLVAMAQARSAEPLVGQTLTGVISGVQSYGFFVEIPPSRVEGLVHVSSLKDDWYEYRSRQNRLVGRKNRRVYLLGDQVEVEIQKVDVLRHQIDLAILLPADQEGSSEHHQPDQEDPGDGEN